ncbi:MAG: hypothetical protein ACOYM3_06960 [Terrimicrobiaceae bacterium]
MSDVPPSDPGFSELDLNKIFLPSWAKPADPAARHDPLVARFGNRSDDTRPSGQGDRRGGRRPDSDARGRKPDRGPGRRDDRQGRGRNDNRREERSRPPAPAPVLNGWSTEVLPDPRGITGLAKQLKTSGKAYPLFDLAFLILEKPERYSVRFRKSSAQATALFQFSEDKSLWLSETDAIRHVLARHLEKFYRREQIQVEPPKGAYSFIAVCGMSDTVLGPPNYHDYQIRLQRLHAERFSNVPFEAFKSRVRMVKDPEFLEKWKLEQSTKEEFYPLETAEGTEPVMLADLAAVERHFRANHAAKLIVAVGEKTDVSGFTLARYSDATVRQLVQYTVADLRRFPLPLAHIVGQQLSSVGLQIFKAHENITYVSVARPRYLDRQSSPVAEGLGGILDYLESRPSVPRAEQWKALLALRVSAADDAARETAVAGDLSWLIHQGHVVDYARRGLEAVRRPQQKPAPKPTPPAGTPSQN